MRRSLVATLAGLLFLASSAPAGAQPDQKAAAQLLFDQGRALSDAGRYAEACPKLAESQRLDPTVGTMLWLADCYENAGKTASAWAQYREAAAAAGMRHDAREQVAKSRAAALEAKLSTLTINVPATAVVPNLEVSRDGAVLGSTQWGLAVPVDPGGHTVEAHAPGRKPWSSTIDVPAKAGGVAVAVPLLDAAGDVAPPPPPGADAPRPARVEEGAGSSTGGAQRTVGILVAGAGLIGVGLGTVFVVLAESSYNASNQNNHCSPNNMCDPKGLQDRSSASALATGATIAYAAGAAALVGGVVLFLTAPRKSSTVALTPFVAPRPGGWDGGLSIARAW